MDDEEFERAATSRLDVLDRRAVGPDRERRDLRGDADLNERMTRLDAAARRWRLSSEPTSDVADAVRSVTDVSRRVARLENPDG